MPFVKVDTGILDSTLWDDRDGRDVFFTALLMAVPREITAPMPELSIDSTEPTGWEVPPGWYGFVEAAGPGIVRRAGLSLEAGMAALARQAAPDLHSRTPDFEGRRMVRVDGGFIILNFMLYRERDYTTAERSKRYRDRKRNASHRDTVTPRRDAVTKRGASRKHKQKHKQKQNTKRLKTSAPSGAESAQTESAAPDAPPGKPQPAPTGDATSHPASEWARPSPPAHDPVRVPGDEVVEHEDHEHAEWREELDRGGELYVCPSCNGVFHEEDLVQVRECSSDACGEVFNGTENGRNCEACNRPFTRVLARQGCPDCMDESEPEAVTTYNGLLEALGEIDAGAEGAPVLPSPAEPPRSRGPTRETWLTPYWDTWVARFGGKPPAGQLANALKPLVDQHGPERVQAHWCNYLASTDAAYASPTRFAMTFGSWSQPRLNGRDPLDAFPADARVYNDDGTPTAAGRALGL